MADLYITFYDGKRQVFEGFLGQELNGNRFEVTDGDGSHYLFNFDYIIGVAIVDESATGD